MSFAPDKMRIELDAHTVLCAELLRIATAENQALRGTDPYESGRYDERRKGLLAQLEESLISLRKHRQDWQALTTSERAQYGDIARLIISTQELAMKLIVLDRENEQALLRRGLLPARQLNAAPAQPTEYVANLYQRYKA